MCIYHRVCFVNNATNLLNFVQHTNTHFCLGDIFTCDAIAILTVVIKQHVVSLASRLLNSFSCSTNMSMLF